MDPFPYLKEIILLREKILDESVYPFSLPVIQNFRSLKFKRPVTFLIGENGSGKSTLIEAIAILMGLNAEGGSKNLKFSSYASYSKLHECLRPSRGIARPKDSYFLRAESFYNVASEIDKLDAEPAPAPKIIDSYGGTSLHNQSHGESFWSLMDNRMWGKGFYVLDEPEAALSPTRQMAALARIHDLVKDKSQFIIATHSPILLSYPDATIYEIRDGLLCEVDYEQTEHFQVTRSFLNHYQDHLDILFDPN